MITIENTLLPTANQWKMVIMGGRNPMNSWEKSDTVIWEDAFGDTSMTIGTNDMKLLTKLAKAGTEHRKFMRMLPVYVDITAPLYWWKELDTYKIGTVANSCSTMHKIAAKEFEIDDFSYEHLIDFDEPIRKDANGLGKFPYFIVSLATTIDSLNYARELYLETKDKKYWWQMIQLLPSSYNQKRTVMLNYEVLANMYHQRKEHKLDEWREFCKWIERLPYSKLITGEKKEEIEE